MAFFQKKRYVSAVFFLIGAIGVVLLGFGNFFDNSSDIESLLLETGLSKQEITLKLKRNEEKKSANRFLDFPEKADNSKGTSYLSNESRGVVVSAGNDSFFYSFDVISPFEVINDTIAGQPILIAYCTVCETAVIADRFVDGQEYFFEATDDLWEDSLVMVNRGDRVRLWAQASGVEITAGNPKTLDFLPFDIITFGQFRAKYPSGKVIIKS